MNRYRFDRRTLLAVVGAALAGCGQAGLPQDGAAAAVAPAVTAPAAAVSPAQQVIAANAKAERDLHLVTRKVINDGDEVIEFYEPLPGKVIFSAAGSPRGASAVRRELVEGRSADAIWRALVPNEQPPAELLAAVERATIRGKSDDSADTTAAQSNEAEAAARVQAAPIAAESKTETSATAEAIVASPIQPLAASGGYCSGQFWTDWGNWAGGNPQNQGTWNYGWYDRQWDGITGTSGYIVCPWGNVSNTGGTFSVYIPGGATSSWTIAPNYYRWSTETAGQDCHWTLSCALSGMANQCNPLPFSFHGHFDSSCYLTKGTSCGDNFDWIDWASSAGSYCQTPNFN